MSNYTPVWPHDNIQKVFENIFVVRGTNITHHESMHIQHSRNMTIIKNNRELTLINTVRLDKQGLKQLEEIGPVKHVIRIGAFHGRDDAFYLEKYDAEFWAFNDTDRPDNRSIDHMLTEETNLPSENSKFLLFKGASPKEGLIYLEQDDGVLICCDSIKNWIEADRFFSDETGKVYVKSGEIQKARISPIWLSATGVNQASFGRVCALKFKHLISAHGDVLKDSAYTDIQRSVSELE